MLFSITRCKYIANLRYSQIYHEKISNKSDIFSTIKCFVSDNFVIMKIIENIKEIRINKGIPQKALADALSVDNAVISNIENGKRELKVAELENIANCLGVEVIDLFTYPEKYVPSGKRHEDVEAILQIRLKDEKKIEILRSVFGDKNYEILNK